MTHGSKSVDYLINTVIDGYLTHDIKNMLKFEPNCEFGRLGCQIAFTVLSGMDLFGFLFGKAKAKQHGKNIGHYVDTFFEHEFDDNDTRNKLTEFFDACRNAIHHHFLPKPKVVISKDPSNSHLIYEVSNQKGNLYALNVYVLGTLFLKSLSQVKVKLSELKDEQQFQERYSRWAKEYNISFPRELKPLLDYEFPQLLPEHATKFENTSITTTSGTYPPTESTTGLQR